MDVKSQDTAVDTTATKDERSLGQKIKDAFTGKKEETSACLLYTSDAADD